MADSILLETSTAVETVDDDFADPTPGAAPLSGDERVYLDRVATWDCVERGYSSVHSTRPQTLGYALTDSPAGLAAWVLDKWRSWSDSGGDLEATFGREALLTLLTVWWVTGCITSSRRDHYDNRRRF